MTNGDHEGRIFYTILTQIILVLLTTKYRISSYKERLPEIPKYAEMRHDMMTSL